MVRIYAKRDVDIVTMSINSPDERKMVQSLLEEQYAINTNLIWDTNDAAEAVTALVPDGTAAYRLPS